MKKIIIIYLLLNLGGVSLRAQTDTELISIFNYPNFSNTQDLRLIQDARVIDKKMRLTAALEGQKGGMWYTKDPLQVDKGFSTEFSFLISSPGGAGDGADGFALIIHNSHQNLENGISGGGMGYDGIPNCIAIEFDTFDNDEQSNNHIAIHTKGREPNKFTPDAVIAINRELDFNLKDSRIHQVKITYEVGKLAVYVDNMRSPILIANIDIAKTIDLDNGKAWVGISSATGAGYANHYILNWSMQTTRPKPKLEEKKVDDKPKEDNKPKELENRKIDYAKTFVVNSRNITIKVWDHQRQDGDIISLNLNGKWLIQNHALKKKVKEMRVNLTQKENFLVLHALNLGKIPPNTAGITVIDGNNQQTIILSSDFKQSQALSILYNGEEK